MKKSMVQFLVNLIANFTSTFLAFVCATIFIFLLIFGCFIAIIAGISSGVTESFEMEKSIVKNSYCGEYSQYNSDNIILIVDVYGVITQTGKEASSDKFTVLFNDIKETAKVDKLKAIVLNINSPGGEVTASDEIYRMIMDVKSKLKIPVIACMRSVCASGGVYIAMAADKIVANPTTMTGSIGVIFSTYNYEKLFKKIGVDSEVYKSGEMKDILNGSRERTQKEIDIIQEMITLNYNQFANVVVKGRPHVFANIDAVKNHPVVGDARILTGEQAQKVGLVDELGTLEDAISLARKEAKIDNAVVFRRSVRMGWIDEIMTMQNKKSLINIMPLEAVKIKPGYNYYILPTILQ